MSVKDFNALNEAKPLIYVLVGVLLFFAVFAIYWVVIIGVLPLAAIILFFRDPERRCPEEHDAVYAPADGRVVEVTQVDDALEGTCWKIGIFLSVFDVHINRMPIGGVVRTVKHTPGRHRNAMIAAAGDVNERNDVLFETNDGSLFLVRQIAGVIARRIVCIVEPGDRMITGQKFGMIRFGSRTELYMPLTYSPTVAVGDRVYAGITKMGEKHETPA